MSKVYYIIQNKNTKDIVDTGEGDCFFTSELSANLCLHNIDVDGRIDKNDYEVKKLNLLKV